MYNLPSLNSYCLLFAVFLPSLTKALTCPPFSPSLPLSSSIKGRSAITNASESLTTALRLALADGTLLDNDTTSFSIDVYSLRDQGSVFTYHFSAPGLANATQGVSKVDSDTIYRIGSISKVFTVYTYLASQGDLSWNQPITKYVPELAQEVKRTAHDSIFDVVQWQDVTLGSLASQLGGIARSSATDASIDLQLRLGGGLPPVPAVNGSYCPSASNFNLPCDRKCEQIHVPTPFTNTSHI
jgi:CubicO group peptidase (beta-lactamase class C family)